MHFPSTECAAWFKTRRYIASCMILSDWFFVLLMMGGMSLSILFNKLTIRAALVGGLLSCAIYIGAGIPGIIFMATFFLIGVAVTNFKIEKKKNEGLAEAHKGKRTAGQVFANVGAAGIIGLFTYLFPNVSSYTPVLIAACFAAATSDTVSSELGNIYGKRFYNIDDLKRGIKGRNGVISVEGTLLGIAASVLIAFIYALFFGFGIRFFIISFAGFVGNIADSILGATFEEKGKMSNNVVNFINTVVAVVVAWLLERPI